MRTIGIVRRSWVAAAFVSTVFLGTALAEEPSKEEPRVIRVMGESTVTAAPDHAEIHLGVVTQGKTANGAASENAKRVDKVLAAVREVVPKAELTTVDYSVNPMYGESTPNRPPTINGYSAQNVVRVATDDLNLVGKIIDAAMGASANDVRGLTFSLKKEGEVRGRALKEAVAKGKAEADAIAAALGVKILRVRSAEAMGEAPPVRPMAMGMMMAKSESAPTPVEPGTLDVHAQVSLTFDIAP